MTMISYAAAPASSPRLARLNLRVFAKFAGILIHAIRSSRETQDLLRAPDAILKDIGLTRLKTNGKPYLFAHRD